jgi:hypothetical protein
VLAWAGKLEFGEAPDPVVLVLTGSKHEPETFASNAFDIALSNDHHQVVVRMDLDHLTVEVSGGMDLKVEL